MAATEITFPDSDPDRVSREVERPAEYVKELGKYRGADGTGRARWVGLSDVETGRCPALCPLN